MTATSDSARPSRWQMLRVLVHLPRLVRLYWRLLCDRRVSLWPKAMLVAAAAYVVFPFDLIPDVIPVLGEVDDAVILLAAAHWFIQWCPADVVAEHARTLAVG
ncbi:MAG TPA: DUF1232 domain-containing protein [Candidatus Binatia bacterium]|nr:DUF1232 domain-containing protein [Candidatus Binatia bacterium]